MVNLFINNILVVKRNGRGKLIDFVSVITISRLSLQSDVVHSGWFTKSWLTFINLLVKVSLKFLMTLL